MSAQMHHEMKEGQPLSEPPKAETMDRGGGDGGGTLDDEDDEDAWWKQKK